MSNFGDQQQQQQRKPRGPQWIVAHLGQDNNWWLQEASQDLYWPEGGVGLLDPRQVQELVRQWDRHQDDGATREDVEAAFYFYTVQSELGEDRVRLTRVEGEVDLLDNALFAMPVFGDEIRGGFGDFLEKAAQVRIRHLNAVRDYARECTETEMQEELDLVDRDRFFSVVVIHPYDEIDEILSWSPAEWDEA